MGTGDNRRIVLILASAFLICGVLLYFALRRPAQMGTDEDTFRTVDALYTAVRLRDVGKVTACEQRLKARRAEGKLPAAAADQLDAVIARTRSGEWQSAAERLYDFMRGQRRGS